VLRQPPFWQLPLKKIAAAIFFAFNTLNVHNNRSWCFLAQPFAWFDKMTLILFAEKLLIFSNHLRLQ